MNAKPEVVETRVIARSRYFTIEQVRLRFADGEERCYERLREWDQRAVIVVALSEPDTLLLIREYACGIDQHALTLPKGTAEPGESDFAAADRELKEEVGLGAGRIELLGELTLAPGHLCHTIAVLLAEELYEQSLPGDEPEDLEVVPVPLADVDRLIQAGTINEARVIAAICLAEGALARRKAPAGTDSAATSDAANARLGSIRISLRNERSGA